jgi:hypothetical protein
MMVHDAFNLPSNLHSWQKWKSNSRSCHRTSKWLPNFTFTWVCWRSFFVSFARWVNLANLCVHYPQLPPLICFFFLMTMVHNVN